VGGAVAAAGRVTGIVRGGWHLWTMYPFNAQSKYYFISVGACLNAEQC
jgi:hypothetical protein